MSETNKPDKAGWYPVLLCYGGRDGVYPGAMWFDETWYGRGVVAFGKLNDTQLGATKDAYEHDPDIVECGDYWRAAM